MPKEPKSKVVVPSQEITAYEAMKLLATRSVSTGPVSQSISVRGIPARF